MIVRNYFIVPIALSGLLACASPIAFADEQRMPATQHQSEASARIKEKAPPAPGDSQATLPSSGHQEEVLGQFEAADANRDGSLTKAEFAAYMEGRAAREYWTNMQTPEAHGTEAIGPRDRTAADADKKPVARTAPTVNE